MTTPTEDIHSCSYFCTRPACVLAQRDELRDSHGAGNQVPPPAQPAAQPVQRLSDERIDEITRDKFGTKLLGVMIAMHREYARSIEAALQPQGWVRTQERMPPNGTPVLADTGQKFPIRACWVAKFSEEIGASDFDGAEDYDEKTDTSYWPEGWYEWNKHEETHWQVDDAVLAWMPLPARPGDAS